MARVNSARGLSKSCRLVRAKTSFTRLCASVKTAHSEHEFNLSCEMTHSGSSVTHFWSAKAFSTQSVITAAEQALPSGPVDRAPVVGVDERQRLELVALVDVGDSRRRQLQQQLSERLL